jgi:hypothetical protein
MTPELARKLGDLVRAGATIVGPRPHQSPSLAGYPACDAEVAKLAEEIWGSVPGVHQLGEGRVISDRSVEQVISDMQMQPDFAALSPESGLAYTHRVAGDVDFYFVSNQKKQPQTIECAFRVTGREPEFWDAETGRMTPAPLWRVQDGRTFVTLSLEQAGSIFIVFRKPATPPADPIIRVARVMKPYAGRPLPKLVITRARYGAFSLASIGMIDLTVKLTEHLQNGQLHVFNYNLVDGDPVPGVLKELRVDYELAGQSHYVSVSENQPLSLPAPGEKGTLRIVRAVYGKFPETIHALTNLPTPKTVDITDRVRSHIHNNLLDVRIDSAFAGSDPVPMMPKDCLVEFTVDGVAQITAIRENDRVRIPSGSWDLLPPEPRLILNKGQVSLISAVAGQVICTTSAGARKIARIAAVPKPIGIDGPWKVSFPPNLGAPPAANFDKLISWPAHADTGIRYFSGTATYRKEIMIPAANMGANHSLELDLGSVEVIAEVRLNGKDLGILWKAPFRVNIDGAARPGRNELEIRVTNLWPNRMIGDEQLHDDCEWNGSTIKRWPDWMINNTSRPSSNRVTFVPWKDWHKDSPLQPSGLLGPVVIRTYVSAVVE